jgi:hypothetical protein
MSEIAKPIKIGIPPSLGVGIECIFRVSGVSRTFNLRAALTIKGINMKEIRKAMVKWRKYIPIPTNKSQDSRRDTISRIGMRCFLAGIII